MGNQQDLLEIIKIKQELHKFFLKNRNFDIAKDLSDAIQKLENVINRMKVTKETN